MDSLVVLAPSSLTRVFQEQIMAQTPEDKIGELEKDIQKIKDGDLKEVEDEIKRLKDLPERSKEPAQALEKARTRKDKIEDRIAVKDSRITEIQRAINLEKEAQIKQNQGISPSRPPSHFPFRSLDPPRPSTRPSTAPLLSFPALNGIMFSPIQPPCFPSK